MAYKTLLGGQMFTFDSVKEVMAKANEEKSGDILAGVAASSDLERIAAKEVLSNMLLKDLLLNLLVYSC
jgi:ethanolamine ammonia-lyase large subunit